MYHRLYNLGIKAYTGAISIASVFNKKALAWKSGRKGIWEKLSQAFIEDHKTIWFHAASLGEAEQGVPIMEKIRVDYPEFRILLTFFSPSGMQNFQRTDLADHIFYLPPDGPKNAMRFVGIVKPKLAFFIKYEIWANYFLELQKQAIPTIIAPAVFRAEQFYFKKPHQGFFLPILRKVSAILTQDQASVRLLNDHGITNCARVGDSRFEKVIQNSQTEFSDPLLEAFAEAATTMICGSSWSVDEKILLELARAVPNLKMIIAPHDISPGNIARISKAFGLDESFLYSDPPLDPTEKRFAIIDNIGILSKVYRLGQLAYIGGAFGQGIHNSLEAVAYGLPVFFGPKHQNFIEPREMIQQGFGHEISDSNGLIEGVSSILSDPTLLQEQSEAAIQYIKKGTGAQGKIMKVVSTLI